MITNKNIICVSSIDWDFVWQGHQEIMSVFASNGNRVLFIENTGVRAPIIKDMPRLWKRFVNWIRSIKGFRKEMENLYVYSPVILPFPYSRVARCINKNILLPALRRWMRAIEFHDPIVWTFLPTGIALDIANNIDTKLLVYYCIADFYKLVNNQKKIKKFEDELIKKCDLIFAQGEILANKCKKLNDNVHIFPFGVRLEAFDSYRKSSHTQPPSDIKDIRKPIIGYVGGIHRHLDFELIKFIAEKHPEWSLVFVGPVQVDVSELRSYRNLFLLGKKDFSVLPAYLYEFSVGIIPYAKSEYTETVFPTKLNEYHAMGKAVISTDIPEVVSFNMINEGLVSVAKTREDFVECIEKAVKVENKNLEERRVESAKKNNWILRIETMSGIMESTIDRKLKNTINWQEQMLKLYRISRRRIIKAGAVVLFFYIILFYTPLVWLMAARLKITQVPRKSDCIVVFSGGVGESGKSGQGYEERVQYAVELYKEGYAENIVFSSGYTYVFQESSIMKALAISLGVPNDVIFLDDRARNTYQNVKFTNEILEKYGWKSILLVSSPYHMLRSQLVFNKNAGDKRVIYAPIQNSLFYSHHEKDKNGKRIWKKINMRQIKGIVHEYIAILYYFWKGWI